MVNVLYWILPGGQFAGCSKPIEGCISDRELLIASGLKEELEEADEVEADRGFANCQDVFAEKKARLITPDFKPKNGAPFTVKQVFRSETIARSRIHIGKHILASVMGVLLKFIYSEKATKFCEIFTLLMTGTALHRTKVR